VPRAVRHHLEPAPLPVNPVREPELIAATWHPLAYLVGQRFYADSQRRRRLEVVGVWSSSEVLLRDVSSRLCRHATATWVRNMVDQYGLDANDEPLGKVDWERLMQPHVTRLTRPVAEAVLERAEKREEGGVELRRLMQSEVSSAGIRLRPRGPRARVASSLA
jgi:hypothetical protein